MIHELPGGYILRTLRLSDLDGPYMSWFEDQDVCRYNSHGKFFKNERYFQDYVSALNTETQVTWAIVHKDDGHVGNISLQGISFINRHADFTILIGNKAHWGSGVGYRAALKLFEHAFEKLNLERIWCATPEPNAAMRKLALKLGMTEEGRRRAHLYVEGKWVDMIEFGILRPEFEAIERGR
jgi:RimJ/RimL family protein N-acetyltransferase